MDKVELKKKFIKKKDKFKRFKRNLRLAKRKTHFCVWLSDIISSMKSDAKNISFFSLMFSKIKKPFNMMLKNNKRFSKASNNSIIRVSNPFNNVGYLYIKFHGKQPEKMIISSSKKSVSVPCEYLHQLIDLNGFDIKGMFEFHFDEEVEINRIYVFSKGKLPEWVQKWEAPCKKANLLAMSTHSDDEQLFFAGVLPLYAATKGNVQVSYFAPPLNVIRYNELLDGLWQIGIKNYPVFAPFYEEWSDTLSEAMENLNKRNTNEEEVRNYIVACMRRFKPGVVIGQDSVNGEYGHGQHMYFASCLKNYIKDAANPNVETEIFGEYGTYSVPKLYLHLYEENKIVLDLDTPMKELKGLTPFQKSQEGFSKHRSQYVWFFPRQLFGTIRHPIKKASQIIKYSPCEWGLVHSTVGLDKERCDMFENL